MKKIYEQLLSNVVKDLEKNLERINTSELPPGTLIKFLYDERTGTYYKPVLRLEERAAIDKLRERMNYSKPRARVKIAVLDTGVMTHHPIIRKVLRGSENFTEEETEEDMDGHGTFVALQLLARTQDIDLYNVKVLKSDRRGNIETVAKGINWCIKNKIDIINLSVQLYPLGCRGDCDVCTACKKALESGISVVAAGGNIPGKISCPAKLDSFGYPIIVVSTPEIGFPSERAFIYEPIMKLEPVESEITKETVIQSVGDILQKSKKMLTYLKENTKSQREAYIIAKISCLIFEEVGGLTLPPDEEAKLKDIVRKMKRDP